MLGTVRHRGFRLLVAGQLASNIGDGVYAVALPWYVLAHGGSVLLLGTVLAAYGIPRTALIAVGGHLADRWGPWTTMLLADAMRMVAVAAFAVSAALTVPHAAVLVPIAIVLGVGEGIFIPGSFSIIPSLLPETELQAGNALALAATQAATLLGPAVGGALVALVGSSAAFALDAASFVVSALTLAAIGTERRALVIDADEPADSPGSVLHLVRRSRVLQIVVLTTLAANLGSGALAEVALPVLSRGRFHAGAGGYGALVAAIGVGALVGTLVGGHRATPRRPAIVASVLFIVESVFFAAVPLPRLAPLAGAALAVAGICNGYGNLLTITAFQRWAPPALLGRLMGITMLAGMGIFPVSVWLGGLVVHAWGAPAVFWLASTVLALAILAGLAQREWREFGRPEASTESVATTHLSIN